MLINVNLKKKCVCMSRGQRSLFKNLTSIILGVNILDGCYVDPSHLV